MPIYRGGDIMRKGLSPDPAIVMQQIREGVRSTTRIQRTEQSDLINDILLIEDSELRDRLNENIRIIQELSRKIPSNIPVAFLDPHLGSRLKVLGKILIPIRKLGARLFTRWYVDPFTSVQKYLNLVLWSSLNEVKNVIINQNEIITNLYLENIALKNEVQNFTKTIEDFEIQVNREIDKTKEEIDNVKFVQEKINKIDFNYFSFANKFSADDQSVKAIFKQYINSFSQCSKVLDIGCGKGIFLELLKENGIDGLGIDSDPDLVSICKEKGLDAIAVDGYEYLSEIESENIDGIFMGHVIEHFPVNKRIDFIKKCYEKLAYGGIFVLETPNTTSSFVMHKVYYLDPTHDKPVHPEALQHICNEIGFTTINSYLSLPIGETNNLEYYNYSLILTKN